MEFKVWVDGIKRVVCGVTDETTCQDIILALAHATGQTGRFTLIEKWRNNERFLLPQDNPLKILHKWGEYASDVHFILRKSGRHGAGAKNKDKFKHNFTPPAGPGNIKKSLTFSGAHGHNVLHPARNSPSNSSFSSDGYDVRAATIISSHTPQGSVDRKDKSPDSRRPQASVPPFTSQDRNSPLRVDTNSKRSRSHDSTLGYGSLERPRSTSPAGLRSPGSGSSVPSPPGTFEHRKSKSRSSRSGRVEQLDLDINSATLITEGESFDRQAFEKKIVEHGSLNDLVKLVELQRERIQLLDSQMKIMDSEIQFWEQKDKELTDQSEIIKSEFKKWETTESQYEVEIKGTEHVRWAEKIEAEKQKEKTIKLEISQLEIKLAKTETETMQCHKKVEELELEIRAEEVRQDKERKNREEDTLAKIAQLKKEIEDRISEGERMKKSLDTMEDEVKAKEEQLKEKKMKVLDLEKEIKILNLDMFRKTPLEVITIEEKTDDKSGRKSPRMPVRKLANFQHLTEGVATAKNPHGMWV